MEEKPTSPNLSKADVSLSDMGVMNMLAMRDELKDRADAYLLIALDNPQPFQELLRSCDSRIANLERRIQVSKDELVKAQALKTQIQGSLSAMRTGQAE
jgi:hypothetical protein